jgi:hypothetical protein
MIKLTKENLEDSTVYTVILFKYFVFIEVFKSDKFIVITGFKNKELKFTRSYEIKSHHCWWLFCLKKL